MRQFVVPVFLAISISVSPAFADEVIKALSKRSQISVEEINGYLSDCDRTQLSMNICAFRDAIAAEFELDAVVAQRAETLTSPEARDNLSIEMEDWRQSIEEACHEQADAEAEGGSMRPMVYSGCITEATELRMTEILAAQ